MKSLRRFPIAISLFCSLILLQLSPRVCFAAEIDQEIEAEAQKLLPTYFTKCGDDYFSKQTFEGNPDTYIIGQYKELTTRIISHSLSQADSLNGIEWKGIIQFTATVMREFVHGKMFEDILSRRKPDVWSEWEQASMLAVNAVPTEKKNGRIIMNQRMSKGRASIDCAAIPR
jgi:hypothetical protein